MRHLSKKIPEYDDAGIPTYSGPVATRRVMETIVGRVNEMAPLQTPERSPQQLTGQIQHYAWGGTGSDAIIPDLLGQPAGDKPWAELWLGIHPKAPTQTVNGVSLSDWYTEKDIPWLLKILDAKQMLSIQVHPTKAQASAGFEKELLTHVADAKRNYKDANPKPEIAIPLTEMWLMGGFLDKKNMVERFQRYDCVYTPFKESIDALSRATKPAEIEAIKKSLYEQVSRLPAEKITRISEQLKKELAGNTYDKSQVEYWIQQSQDKYPNDVGVLSFFMLNLVHLTPHGQKPTGKPNGDDLRFAPGEAFFTPAGVPHFYMEGACVEHMANSDNVLRAGFTPKHKDIDELLRVINYRELTPDTQSVQPQLDQRTPGVERLTYQQTDNEYFATEMVTHKTAGSSLTVKAQDKPQIGLVMAGKISLTTPDGKGTQTYEKGQSFLIPESRHGKSFKIESLTQDSRYVKASTPVNAA